MAMDHEQAVQTLLFPLPVIPRLDRVDRLLHYLEEKHISSARYAADDAEDVGKLQVDQLDGRCKSLASVLDEVPVKGSLMERVASLEHRMLKLTMELNERERLQQSFRNAALGCCCEEKLREVFDSAAAKGGTHSEEEMAMEKQPVSMRNKRRRKMKRIVQIMQLHRRWLGCFRARI